jgi:hypothetical protein
MKRLLPYVALSCLGATCKPNTVPGVSSDVRVDLAGDPPDGVESVDPDMCVTPNGTVYVVWVDDRAGTPDVWMNRKLPGDERDVGWLPAAVRVNQIAGNNVWAPQVACSDTHVHVVWEDDRDGEIESHQIRYNVSSTQGDTWVHPEDLLLEEDEEGRSNSFEPVIAADGANVFVAWSDNTFGAFDIFFRRSSNSGLEWLDAPLRIDRDQPAGSAFSAGVQIATAAGGNTVYLVWEDTRGGAFSDVYFSRSLDAGQSFSATDIRLDVSDDPGANNSFSPQIGADGNDIYVVWHDDRNGENNDVFMSFSSDGGLTWTVDSRAEQEDPAGVSQSLFPSVCVSGNTAHVGWHDNRVGGFYRAFYNRAVDGLWAGVEVRLDGYKVLGGERPSRDVKMACDGDTVVAAWFDQLDDEFDVGYNDIRYNWSEDAGATWAGDALDKPPRLDSILEGTAFKIDLGLHVQDGTIFAAWGDGRNGANDIFAQQVLVGEEAPLVADPNAAQ